MPIWVMLLLLFLLTVGLVYGVRYYAQCFLMDEPNHRSSHLYPTPRGGGLGCVLAFTIAAFYLYLHKRLMLNELELVSVSLGVAVIGFWDDHRHIAARWRLFGYGIAALWAILLLQGLPKLPLPLGLGTLYFGWSGYALGLLFLAWTLNLFNFMDGTDGIAAAEAIFVATGLAWFMQDINANLALLALCLAVVCLGFLVWNWPPAKIFMGDVGSSFIGFMLGVLIVLFSHTHIVFAYIGLILFAVFIVDASFTLLRRIVSGQKYYEAHCSHAYQLLAKRHQPKGHLRVLLGVILVNLGYLFPLAALAFKLPDYAWACLLSAYLPLIYMAHTLKAGEK
ncbi:MAG: glycosyltransferase family 4 protein [Methylococcaceae bacterium]|nr:glycosyltransferase family 4 protein [Methylococcaceae bacterium]